MPLEDLSPEQQRALKLGHLLLSNPDVRRDAQRLAKKADPTLNLPEVELEDSLAKMRADMAAQAEANEKELLKERVARRKMERDAEIVSKGYTVEEIEKIIVDYSCTYEAAYKIAEMMRKTADPSPAEIGRNVGEHIDLRPGADWKKLGTGDAKKRSATIAHEMVNDFRGRRSPAAR